MGEQNRGSSGGGTGMIVVAILGGILVFGCCGGAVVLGLGAFVWVDANERSMFPPPPLPPAPQVIAEMPKELVPLKLTPHDGGTPVPTELPALSLEEKKK
jgi:hypothetical protein